MYNAGFQKLNLNYIYLLFEVKPLNLKKAVQGMKALNFAGFNITVPFKEEILPLLDNLTPEAKKIGAVNTVWQDPTGKLIGDNTDGKGFLQALKLEKGRTTGQKGFPDRSRWGEASYCYYLNPRENERNIYNGFKCK